MRGIVSLSQTLSVAYWRLRLVVSIEVGIAGVRGCWNPRGVRIDDNAKVNYF